MTQTNQRTADRVLAAAGFAASSFAVGTFVYVLLSTPFLEMPAMRKIMIGDLIMFSGMALFCFAGILRSAQSTLFGRLCISSGVLLGISGLVLVCGNILSLPGVQAEFVNMLRSFSLKFGRNAPFVGTAILAIGGYLLFLLKVRKLIVYAYGEIVFALTSCYVVAETPHHDISVTTVSVFGAAIYLVVRGLDNRRKAILDRAARTQ